MAFYLFFNLIKINEKYILFNIAEVINSLYNPNKHNREK